MGEMAVRNRPRKDLAASFNRLRRLVNDVKSARKSLVAHHRLVAEFVSVSLYSSPKDPLPHSHLQLEDPQEEIPFPLSASTPIIPPARSCGTPFQPINLQEACLAPKSSFPCSFPPSKCLKNPSFSSLRSLTLKISASLTSSPRGKSSGDVSCIRQDAEHKSSKILPPLSHPSKRLSQPAFWTCLFLVSLCFFLCTGKELAVGVATSAYIILWITRRLRSCARKPPDDTSSSSDLEIDHVRERQGSNLNRSSTIPASTNIILSSDSQEPRRSRSFSTLHGCLQEDASFKEHDLLLHPQSSAVISSDSQIFSARVKLGMILVLALSGLAYGQIAAMCMCSCCIMLLSITQAWSSRRCWRKS